MENIFPPTKQKGKVQWKGTTKLQLSSKIHKNNGNIAISENNFHNAFISRPLKHYRRDINIDNDVCNPRTSVKIDILNQPNGYNLVDPSNFLDSSVVSKVFRFGSDGTLLQNHCIEKNLVNVLDLQLPNSQYEKNTKQCRTDTICVNQVSKALKKARSSSGVIKENYFTSSSQYYINRNMDSNIPFQEIEPFYSNNTIGEPLSINISTCKNYMISAFLNNNQFSYKWIDGSQHDVILPDGYYDLNKLNDELKLTMIRNRHYYIDNSNYTKVFLLKIVNNIINETVQLQCVLNNKYSNNIQYYKPPVYLYIGHNTVSWNNDVSYNNILPAFIIPESFSEVIGFKPGNYPNNVNNKTDYSVDSNIDDQNISSRDIKIIDKTASQTLSQHIFPGSISSGSFILRKKYNEITNNGFGLRSKGSLNFNNALAYSIPTGGRIKNMDKPFPHLCSEDLESKTRAKSYKYI